MPLTPAQRQAAVRARAVEELEKLKKLLFKTQLENVHLEEKLENETKQLDKALKKIHKLEIAALKSKIPVL